jgi:hypothetical protein
MARVAGGEKAGRDSCADSGGHVADDPRDTVRELKELVVAYAKQETLDPLKGLGRYVGFGVAGALLLATGFVLLAIGGLRALQTETGTTFTGNWSWAPYGIVVAALALVATLAWTARGRRKERP